MLAAPDTICFGRWRLDPQRRVLLAGGQPVALNGRAFDMLALLVDRRGEVLSRDEIVSHVWQGLAVGDNNLTVQMSTLRRTLGEHGGAGLIVTVPGRGYRFVGEMDKPPPPAPGNDKVSRVEPVPEALPVLPMPDEFRSARPSSWRHMSVFAMILVLIGSAVAGLTWRPPPPPRLSIAVLPLRNVSADHAQDHLAEALTDDLTTDLAHIPESTVIARESTETWRAKLVPVQTIGRALGVRYLVEGSVRFDDDRFRVNAQLVDASTGVQMWADRFDTAQGKMTEVRDAIVRHLASSLDFQLAQIESARSLKDRPSDPDALDLFFRARAIVDTDTSLSSLTNAQAKLEQALQQQPDFADALAELGTILLMKVEDMVDPDETKDMRRAREAIAHALAMSPRNADALAARARELAAQDRCVDATYSANAALIVEPSSVAATVVLARCARTRGDLDEAAAYMEDVLRLTPESLSNKRRFLSLGYIRLLQHRIPEASNLLQRAVAGEPDDFSTDILGRVEVTHLLIIAAKQMGGHAAEARSLYLDYTKHWPYRTAQRFAAYYGKTESHLPGFISVISALHEAGMPMFADENVDVSASSVACSGNGFGITPLKLTGGKTWTTSELADKMRSVSPPIVIDIGPGVAIPPLAYWWSTWSSAPETPIDFVRRTMENIGRSHPTAIITVMGDSPFDCDSFEAATALVSEKPARTIAWYRGGEEAWASHNMPSQDARP